MLNEMLNNAKPNERFAEGDAYDVSSSFFVAGGECGLTPKQNSQQMAQKSKAVQPKIQRWIEESAENNPEAMGTFLPNFGKFVELLILDLLRSAAPDERFDQQRRAAIRIFQSW